MAKYTIVFAPTAAKQFRALTQVVQLRIATAIAKLAETPHVGKPLKGEFKAYRSYRVGDYRVVYYIRHTAIQIEIIRVAHRREVYRGCDRCAR